MPDATIVDAAGKSFSSILDVGVVGGVCILLIGALYFAVKKIDRLQTALNAEKDKRIEDAERRANVGDGVKDAMQANTVAIKSMLDLVREGARP